jgi:hypothetical protein
LFAIVTAAFMLLALAFQLYTRIFMKRDSVNDIFALIAHQGYTPTVGFAGTYEPGNIIQVVESNSLAGGGERALEPPLVFMWASECFPGVEARDENFVIPQSGGSASAALTAGAPAISRVAPAISVKSNAVLDYRLAFNNVRVRTLARGEISGKLSDKCVAALNQETTTGDKINWYRTIVEAVVADGLSYEMHWKANTTADAREDVVEKATRSLANIADTNAKSKGKSALELNITQNDTQKTVMSARGLIVIGYRARPMQPLVGN